MAVTERHSWLISYHVFEDPLVEVAEAHKDITWMNPAVFLNVLVWDHLKCTLSQVETFLSVSS